MRAAWREWTAFMHLRRALKTSRDADALTAVTSHLTHAAVFDREDATKFVLAAAVTGDLGAACTLMSRHLEGAPLYDVNAAGFSRHRPFRAERAAAVLRTYAELARSAGGFGTLIAEQLTGEDDDFNSIVTLFASARGGQIAHARTIARMLVTCAGWDWPTDGPGCAAGIPSTSHAGLSEIAPPRTTEDPGQLFTLLVADVAEAEGYPIGEGLDPHGVADALAAFRRLSVGTYYVGLTIDQMQADLIKAPRTELTGHAWKARAAVLPHRYLGEKGGWYGPNPGRKRIFHDTGHIVIRRAAA